MQTNLIDVNGKEITGEIYEFIFKYPMGKLNNIFVVKHNGLYGEIGQKGNVITPPKYKSQQKLAKEEFNLVLSGKTLELKAN